VIKKAIEKIQNDKTIINEIERRKKGLPNENINEYNKFYMKLPEILQPNPNGLTKEQMKIYENFAYEYPNKIDNNPKIQIVKVIIKILKEVLINFNSPKTKKNYEFCMMNIQNFSYNNMNFTQEELNMIEKCISDNKIEDIKLIKDFVNTTYRYVIFSLNKKNYKLLNILLVILKGWINVHPEIIRDITSLFMKSYDISIRFNTDIHIKFIQNKLIYQQDYEDYLFNFLQNPVTRKECVRMLNELDKKKY
jgi:hypothetical protein